MDRAAAHAQWQAHHYTTHEPIYPCEDILRKLGFSVTIRPKEVLLKNILDGCGITQETKILDLGCGTGITLERISKTYGASGEGIDISESIINKAKKLTKANIYSVGNGSKLPFKADSFDLIISMDSLEHILDYENVLAEMIRVVKPGGKIIINTINKKNKYTIEWLFQLAGSNYLLRRAGHIKDLYFDVHELAQKCESKGFKNINTKLYDAAIMIFTDCILYLFLIIMEYISQIFGGKYVRFFSVKSTDFIAKRITPTIEKLDKKLINNGYSNAFFIIGQK